MVSGDDGVAYEKGRLTPDDPKALGSFRPISDAGHIYAPCGCVRRRCPGSHFTMVPCARHGRRETPVEAMETLLSLDSHGRSFEARVWKSNVLRVPGGKVRRPPLAEDVPEGDRVVIILHREEYPSRTHQFRFGLASEALFPPHFIYELGVGLVDEAPGNEARRAHNKQVRRRGKCTIENCPHGTGEW